MAEYYYDIFYEPLQKYNYLEVADWIKRCRSYIDRSQFDNEREYLWQIKKFSDEWEKHYTDNKSFYSREKYKTALLSFGVPQATACALIGGKNSPINTMSFQTPDTHNPFISDLENMVEDEERKAVKEYIIRLTECFSKENKNNYKQLLDELIKIHLTKKIVVQIKKLNGKNINMYKSYDELIKAIEDTNSYKNEIVNISPTKVVKVRTKRGLGVITRAVKVGYQQRLLEYGISKTVFNNFIDDVTCEQQFHKDLFVNVGFLLSLPFSELNTLLSYNGYSLEDSTKKFDEVIDRAFKIGFGRNMAIDLIDYYNFEKEDEYASRGSKKKFIHIPNLD